MLYVTKRLHARMTSLTPKKAARSALKPQHNGIEPVVSHSVRLLRGWVPLRSFETTRQLHMPRSHRAAMAIRIGLCFSGERS
ncbi:hypothetical protein VTO73DRAFT_9474 [Trametes versicolor]